MSTEKDRANVRVFPPALPLATLVVGTALQRVLPLPVMQLPAPVRRSVGGVIVIGAILLGGSAVFLFRRSGQSENPWKPTTSIVERGPYRFTRNPMYLQMVLLCIGFAILLSNPWILVLTPLCAWALQRFVIRHEEAYLKRKFGDDYRAYTRRVRRWI